MAVELQPYVGPRPFELKDAELFFGRQREANDLLSLIMAYEVVLLYAQSGAGKTSLLNTKLIPSLQEEGFEVLPIARMQGLIPASVPVENALNLHTLNALLSWSGAEFELETLSQLSLTDYLKGRRRSFDADGSMRPRLVVFDQFEELFTAYPHRWEDRQDFFRQVGHALREDHALRVLLIAKEDNIAKFDPYIHLLPEKLSARYRLERLRYEAALAAAKGPLDILRHKAAQSVYMGPVRSFRPGTAEKLVQDLMAIRVETGAGQTESRIGEFVEPVQLQIVCHHLWKHLPGDVDEIGPEHLESFGNVDEALTWFYDECIKTVVQRTKTGESELRDWFERTLITTAGTRGIVYRDESEGRTGGIPNKAAEELENLHLIRKEWRSGSAWYELIHDRFVEPIRKSNIAFSQAVHVPFLGHISAETPIPVPDADSPPSGEGPTVELSRDIVQNTQNIYALGIQGDSMVDALINDGDIVLMRHQERVENGELAAVWIRDQEETTLKRFYLEGKQVRLQPANPTMSAMYFAADNVEVMGKVMAVIRQLH